HLGQYGASKALTATRSPKALPALRNHLKESPKEGESWVDWNEARIGMIILSETHPQETLLRIAEDSSEHPSSRGDCLRKLQDYDHATVVPRILALYRNEVEEELKWLCLRLLEEEQSDDLTMAMIEHALTIKGDSKLTCGVQDYLLSVLNLRLDTSFRKFSELTDYLRARR